MRKFLFVFMLMLMFFINCNIFNCDDEMDDVRARRGTPEEVDRYDSKDYHSVDWWYWTQGICYTFTWGKYVDGCEVSTYQFEPIEKSNTNETLKLEIKNQIPTTEENCWEHSY